MSLVSFERQGRRSYGIAVDGGVREASRELRTRYTDLRSLIAAGACRELSEDTGGSEFGAEAVRFLPVIPNPDKILCVGVNYLPHIREMGRQVPEHPVVFVRFPGSLTGHRQPIVRPVVSEQFDFEGELAVVIGRRARHVSRESALDCLAGYCCFMDGSIRDWQGHTPQFTPGKNFDRSGAVGPGLVTTADIGDPGSLHLTTRVNGEVMQSGQLSDLVFDIPALIEYCSTFTELLPGDIIATGTPGGVGAARTPPVWLAAGDVVEVDIPGVGLLWNTVEDEVAREAP